MTVLIQFSVFFLIQKWAFIVNTLLSVVMSLLQYYLTQFKSYSHQVNTVLACLNYKFDQLLLIKEIYKFQVWTYDDILLGGKSPVPRRRTRANSVPRAVKAPAVYGIFIFIFILIFQYRERTTTLKSRWITTKTKNHL